MNAWGYHLANQINTKIQFLSFHKFNASKLPASYVILSISLDNDSFIGIYWLFAAIFCKCIPIAIYIFYMFPIMVVLYLVLSVTHYAQSFADLVGGHGSLFQFSDLPCKLF